LGLGSDATIERVVISWPSGQTQAFERLEANHHYIVREPESGAQQVQEPDADRLVGTEPMFTPATAFPEIMHHEDAFDDFALQPLLPNKLSQFGPGMAWGDVDADGDDDLFIGGAAGYPGTLWMNQGDGNFQRHDVEAFVADRDREDLGCLFFDADGDGDLDLYVVSGGIVIPPQADRLYLNDGFGNFTNASDRLPQEAHSGSVVVASDFDRDGDLDLFVGSRVIPGQYPLAPRSQLLRNDAGRFTDVGQEVAPDLVQAGLVTGAVWSDANGDGWDDLLVTYEWGPIRLFLNRQGQLKDVTESVGLAEYTGWWNGIVSGDLDNDGDLDYVATNWGLNTKYHASREQPALLYYGDFDNSGRMRLVEAEYEDEVIFPVRGRSCSTHAMPFLAGKFRSYRDFALADLSAIYTDACLSDAQRFAATTLESCALINEGTHFRVVSLTATCPELAQLWRGVVRCEFGWVSGPLCCPEFFRSAARDRPDGWRRQRADVGGGQWAIYRRLAKSKWIVRARRCKERGTGRSESRCFAGYRGCEQPGAGPGVLAKE
jgi:enediyne biosynthesis protein E4